MNCCNENIFYSVQTSIIQLKTEIVCKYEFHYNRLLCFYLLILFLSLSSKIYSQEIIPLYPDYSRAIDNSIIENGLTHTSFLKPYLRNTLNNIINTDSILSFSIVKPTMKKGWILRKWRYESLIKVDSSDYTINVDPLFDFGYGRNRENTTIVNSNYRGVKVWGSLGDELYYETSLMECQSEFLPYLADYAHSSTIIPGQGRFRRVGANEFDYSIVSGLISFSFKKHYQLVAGNGKLFAGDGYRSLLLSDNTYSYPYFRISANYKKWSFTKIFALTLNDTIPLSAYGLKDKRLAGFNIITYTANHWLQLSLFEGNIFKYPNERKNIEFNYLFLNPIIGLNSAIQDINFSSVLGTGLKVNFLKHFEIYNQLVISNLQNNVALKDKYGLQAGIKYYNAFFIKNLFIQAEYNMVKKQTYFHTDSLLNYSHDVQPLAHPYGNNFTETIYILQYNYKYWQLNGRWVNGIYGNKNLSALGKKTQFVNFIQYETPFISAGPETNTKYITISLSYLLNASTNRKIEAGYVLRDATITGKNYNTDYFFIAFRTVLDNWYYDF
jgi:hypothetical protein